MSVLVRFITNIESTIADVGGIAAVDTTFDLDAGDGAKLPTLGAGEYIYAIFVDGSGDWEIVKVTAVSTDECTIVRGEGDTTPMAFAQSDVVYFPATHVGLEDIVDVVNDNADSVLESGTKALFFQNSAPTGWTRDETYTDQSMVCIAGTGSAGSGGGVSPQSVHSHIATAHTHGSGTYQFQVAYSSGSGFHFRDADANAHVSMVQRADVTTESNSVRYLLDPLVVGWTYTQDGQGVSGSGGAVSTQSNTAPYYQEAIVCEKD